MLQLESLPAAEGRDEVVILKAAKGPHGQDSTVLSHILIHIPYPQHDKEEFRIHCFVERSSNNRLTTASLRFSMPGCLALVYHQLAGHEQVIPEKAKIVTPSVRFLGFRALQGFRVEIAGFQ